eukprot:TRINITY_DN6823_c0_g1_i1.p1 TRINITY_DN6823_c0_g1~~TRINITY_DN6823_c0_g1_i1.p1  ORF type:complete len:101 (+),score=3.89 TRINITY_DN6823_c0_g1_i1:65-367(+)
MKSHQKRREISALASRKREVSDLLSTMSTDESEEWAHIRLRHGERILFETGELDDGLEFFLDAIIAGNSTTQSRALRSLSLITKGDKSLEQRLGIQVKSR